MALPSMRRAGAIRQVGSLLLILATPLLVITLLQDKLLYFPDRLPLAQWLSRAQAAGLAPWPDAAAPRGLLAEPRPGPAGGTVVVLHGNAGSALFRDYYLPVLQPLGLRVVLLEYPGYGPREGALGEKSFVADASAAVRDLRATYGAPILLLGESLGAGVAAAVAAAAPESVDALLLATPWDTLANVAAHHYPWLPVRLLLADRYDSVGNLSRFAGRSVVVVAGGDEIIPPRFAEALYRALPAEKRLTTVADARHNEWFDGLDAAWWREQVGWLLAPAR
jgi:pimeloyl-ACP methyl ester carboxylesterase